MSEKDESSVRVGEVGYNPDNSGIGVRFNRDTEVRGRTFRATSRAILTKDEAREVIDRARGGNIRRAARKITGRPARSPIDITEASKEDLKAIGIYEDKSIHVEQVK